MFTNLWLLSNEIEMTLTLASSYRHQPHAAAAHSNLCADSTCARELVVTRPYSAHSTMRDPISVS